MRLLSSIETVATNTLLNAALVAALFWLQSHGVGVLHRVSLRPLTSAVIVVVALDFAFYVAHVAMHEIPVFWRFHCVHHSDPAVDVTTTIRQHPGEGIIRYAFMAAFAIPLGASPGAFAVYRVWSALGGLLEHANVRVPLLAVRPAVLHLHSVQVRSEHRLGARRFR